MRIYKLKEEMTEISCYYAGDLKCDSIHISSGEKIRTDAPVDHYGKGDNFSPTDLLATSVGTCLLTIMAIKARSNGWEIEDINLKIKKNMTENSNRKIKELIIDIFIPSNLPKIKFDFLVSAAHQCPVTKSLSESISLKIKWHYKGLIKT